ncbi:MAG: ATP-binding protein [Bacteroidia bacterium]
MLTKLYLSNYRCYEIHEIEFSDTTVIVGKNNAGKSTLIEALRLVSIVTDKYKNAVYKSAPPWTGLGKIEKGIRPSIGRLEFSFDQIINQYGDPPAIINAFFKDSSQIKIFINIDGELFCQIIDSNGKPVNSSILAKETQIHKINILPQISPLQIAEKPLDKDYVNANLFSSLASRHFRNQLSYLNEYFNLFQALAESSWPSLRIVNFIKGVKSFNEVNPELIVQEGGFSTEVGRMGHGLQMWLQTIWFLARTPQTSTIVLDEPDVYMHADLQRKLIRILKGNFYQVITATHSIEIMSEVDYHNILVIDRRKEKSFLASDFPTIQKVIYNDIGSIHNLELARLWSAKKMLMVEGDDINLLKKFQNKLFPKSEEPLDNIPNMDIGGWGGWPYAIGSKMVLKNAADETIKVFCIFDSDYHIKPDIENRYEEAGKKGIEIHIWEKKEIENYFLVPSVILRALRKKNDSILITREILESKLNEIAENMKQEIEDNFASEVGKFYRRQNKIHDFIDDKYLNYETKNINVLARKIVEKKWSAPLSVVPGKKVLKELNKWLSSEYKVNTNITEIGNNFKVEEIDPEMANVLSAIEKGKSLK